MSYEGDIIPTFAEQNGSIFLRCNHMNYSRAVLNSNWHRAREAEPKDYDFSRDPVRDMKLSTYKHICNVSDSECSTPETSYQAASKDIFLKHMYSDRNDVQPVVNKQSLGHLNLDRDVGEPSSGYGAVLQRHHSEHDAFYLETTHMADFQPPYHFVPAPECPPDFEDKSNAYRKCRSQFTDTDTYNRLGRNTWLDESGVYGNTHFKREVTGPTSPMSIEIK